LLYRLVTAGEHDREVHVFEAGPQA
jgi:hypothetical protein